MDLNHQKDVDFFQSEIEIPPYKKQKTHTDDINLYPGVARQVINSVVLLEEHKQDHLGERSYCEGESEDNCCSYCYDNNYYINDGSLATQIYPSRTYDIGPTGMAGGPAIQRIVSLSGPTGPTGAGGYYYNGEFISTLTQNVSFIANGQPQTATPIFSQILEPGYRGFISNGQDQQAGCERFILNGQDTVVSDISYPIILGGGGSEPIIKYNFIGGGTSARIFGPNDS